MSDWRVIATMAVTLGITAGASRSAAAQTTTPSRGNGTTAADSQAVLAVVQRMFDAMRTKDTAAFRDIFEPNAKLVGMRTRPNGEQIVQVLPWDRFGAFMASDTRAPWIERAWSPEVRIRGTLATVWAEYDFHFGETPSHCGVDAVQLLRTPAGWKIVSIADTYEPTGCPSRLTRHERPAMESQRMRGLMTDHRLLVTSALVTREPRTVPFSMR